MTAGIKAMLAERAALAEAGRRAAPRPRNYGNVMGMEDRAEQAASRFMDAGFEAGLRDHPWSPAHGMWHRPSTIWYIGWSLTTFSHRPLMPALLPQFGRHKIGFPANMAAILEYAAVPSIDEGEAEHRAAAFAQDALDRARQLYRDGFYADPFTFEPTRRPDARHSA